MQWKKTSIRIVGILLILFICNYIGQNFVKPAKEKDNQLKQEIKDEKEINLLENKDWIYKGEQIVTDNPWGNTIKVIDMEDESKALFMTPETNAILLKEIKEKFYSISFKAKIHPWIKSKDGILLIIYIQDKNTKEILKEEKYEIDSKEKKIEFYLEEYKDREIEITFYCNAGNSGNMDGDWLVLSEIKGVLIKSDI